MLVSNFDELLAAVRPILQGDVGVAAFDTETSEIFGDRFTPFGTTSRIAGFSISYDTRGRWEQTDLYAAIRHQPYDWRRRRDLILKDSSGDGQAWVQRLEQDEGVGPDGWLDGWDPNLPVDEVRDLWRELFGVAGVTWRAHNWPFDAKMVLVEGVELPWDRLFDTQTWSVFTDERPHDKWADAVVDGEKKRVPVHGGHGLKHLGERYLKVAPDAQRLLQEAKHVLQCESYAHLPLRTIIAPYGCMDTRLCLDMGEHELLRPLASDDQALELIGEHHREIRRVVEMESRGVVVDADLAAERGDALVAEQGRIRRDSRQALHGVQLELDRPAELEVQLYQTFGLPMYREKRDTQASTLKQVRAKLAAGVGLAAGSPWSGDDAIRAIDYVLDYRKATKELTAFYLPMQEYAEAGDGKLFPILNPLRARTTRYSAAKPNVQQATRPKKGHELDSVRACYKPRDGHVLIPLDYSQQELRVAAHYAQAIPDAFQYRFSWGCTLERRGDCKGKPPHGPDEVHLGRKSWSRAPGRMGLVEGFLTGERSYDPHGLMVATCHELGVEIDRDDGKTTNFALLYGAFWYKLAETIDCSIDRAKQLYGIFWDKAYPELGRVKDFIGERLRRVGPQSQWSHQTSIRTLHGAAVFLDSPHLGLNYLVQRSCREILLKAINGVADHLEEHAPEWHLLFPVHDELILEVPADLVDQAVVRDIARIMVEAGSRCSIPMIVDPAICRDNWAQKEGLPEGWGWNGVTDTPELEA